jgi:hypothetical protein
MDQYIQLIDELSGPETCSPLSPFQPRSEEQAIASLLTSRELLQDLSNELAGETDAIPDQFTMGPESYPGICRAFARYSAVGPYIRSL